MEVIYRDHVTGFWDTVTETTRQNTKKFKNNENKWFLFWGEKKPQMLMAVRHLPFSPSSFLWNPVQQIPKQT